MQPSLAFRPNNREATRHSEAHAHRTSRLPCFQLQSCPAASDDYAIRKCAKPCPGVRNRPNWGRSKSVRQMSSGGASTSDIPLNLSESANHILRLSTGFAYLVVCHTEHECGIGLEAMPGDHGAQLRKWWVVSLSGDASR